MLSLEEFLAKWNVWNARFEAGTRWGTPEALTSASRRVQIFAESVAPFLRDRGYTFTDLLRTIGYTEIECYADMLTDAIASEAMGYAGEVAKYWELLERVISSSMGL